MNYYPFHMGDYAAHTMHLEPMEDLAYRRMLDLYYLREAPLPADVAQVARLVRLRSNSGDVEAVLKEFFILTELGWVHERCDKEITHMQDKQTKARASAEASVNARKASAKSKTPATSAPAEPPLPTTQVPDGADLDVRLADVERTLNERLTDVELPTPTPTPTPKRREAKASSSAAKLPTCPYGEIVGLYHEILPELPGVRVMDKDREKAILEFWKWVLSTNRPDGTPRASTADEAIAWTRDYLNRARDNDFIMGRGPRSPEHANWRCTIEYLLSTRGMKKVIEETKEAA